MGEGVTTPKLQGGVEIFGIFRAPEIDPSKEFL